MLVLKHAVFGREVIVMRKTVEVMALIIFSFIVVPFFHSVASAEDQEVTPKIFQESPVNQLSDQERLELLEKWLTLGVSIEPGLAACREDEKTCRIGGSTWCCHQSKRCNFDVPGCDG
ncbi:MAG: hypothetical protein ACK5YJ_01050 [Curvibacter sp.]